MPDTRTILCEPCGLCQLRNRTGSVIVAALGLLSLSMLFACLMWKPHAASSVLATIPSGGKLALMILTAIGAFSSVLLLCGVYWNNMFLCLPWTVFGALCVLLNLVGLIGSSAFGGPLSEGQLTTKIITFALIFLAFGLQVYAFWIVLCYVMELKDNKASYEPFPNTESRSGSRKRKSRSPIFKIRDDE